MKKISAVLLVLVLVGSVAFAGFTGSADVTFGVDLDTGDFGFANGTAFDIDVVFHEEVGSAKGEGDIYAEIAASFSFGYVADQTATTITEIDIAASIDSAKIYGDKWSVSILGALAAPDFAVSAFEKNSTTGVYQNLKTSTHVVKGAGVVVEYDGYKVGISVPYTLNNFKTPTYDFMGAIQTKELEVADGLKLTLGAAAKLAKVAGNAASVSAKGAFATDDYSAKVAADVIYDGGVLADAAVQFALTDPSVTVDAYYATEGDAPVYTAATKHLVSVQAKTVIEGVTLTVFGKDIINQTILGGSASYKASDEITVGVNGGYTLKGASAGDFYAGGDVTYTAEDFKLKVDGKYADTASVASLKVNATLTSTTLVDGATLSLAYNSGNYLASPLGLGKITAKALIEF
ncbi:MAG: hypothetical protein WCY44_11990 [Sphaerochaetaceae bacterium]